MDVKNKRFLVDNKMADEGGEKMPKEILKPTEVARILGVSPQYVREHIRRGIWKFGECVPKKVRGKTTDEFNIYRAKFENHIGRKLNEEEIN